MDKSWGGKSSTIKRAVKHIRIEGDDEIDDVFHFGATLGQGCFGVVIEAVNRATNAKFAVKLINKEKAGSAGVKLLEREVSIMKKVFHKHIVHLEEVYETSKKMFLVMELCDKGGLDELLKKRVRFSEEETLCVMKQLISAVVYLHENNIVHRDLKLENILLCEPDVDEKPINIKLTDFGLSYILDGAGSDYMMQQVCGTPMYMAPEVITNLGYSERCDVWSCGVIMYYLLNGAPPFVANTEEELHNLIKSGEVKYSESHWDPVSITAKQLIEWMMKIDPARRCSAKEVLHDPWILGITNSTNGPRLNVLDLMGEELIRQKLERSQSNSDKDANENVSNNPISVFSSGEKTPSNEPTRSSSNLTASPKPGKPREKRLTSRSDSKLSTKSLERRSPPANDKKSYSPARSIDRKSDSFSKERKSELNSSGNSTKSVPSYMQPTKSSSAPKHPNTKDKRTKR
eukprot:Seg2716.3 transcript_id=Seg2716.3/GoldUCD/mRNA.D3Y31 product="Serine/threonine-protein kinase 33" protein_id=Seg2716.3/GoldUCD/D3Y31